MDKPTQEQIEAALLWVDSEPYPGKYPLVLAAALRESQAEVLQEQHAHNEIATLCFSVGVETDDGTSLSAVKNLVAEVARRQNLFDAEAQLRREWQIRAEKTEADNAELRALFDLQRTRMTEATTAWQKAHPDKAHILPDLGRLLEWLLAEVARLHEIVDYVTQIDDGSLYRDTSRTELGEVISEARKWYRGRCMAAKDMTNPEYQAQAAINWIYQRIKEYAALKMREGE